MHRVAQAVGEAVNASRGAISEMKAQIEQVRLERAMQGKDSSTHDEDDPAEMRLKQQIDAHKTEYKVYLHLSLLPSLPSTWIQRGLSASSAYQPAGFHVTQCDVVSVPLFVVVRSAVAWVCKIRAVSAYIS